MIDRNSILINRVNASDTTGPLTDGEVDTIIQILSVRVCYYNLFI